MMIGVIAGCAVFLHVVHAWELVPPPANWTQVLSSFPAENSIEPYVKNYVAPFWELQRAERDDFISIDVIRSSINAAASLISSVTSVFKMTDDVFDTRDASIYNAVLVKTTAPMLDPSNPDHANLAPVFRPLTIQRFVFQRLNDMIVCAANADQMNQMVADFNQYILYNQSQIESMSDSKLRKLIVRNLDFVEISRYSARRIRQRYGKDMTMDDLKDLKHKLHSLGNSASGKAISSMSVIAIAVAYMFV